jgi:hypothetical protein
LAFKPHNSELSLSMPSINLTEWIKEKMEQFTPASFLKASGDQFVELALPPIENK